MDIEITGGRIFYTFPFEIPILGKFQITETLVVSWLVMLLITGLCIWLTHDLKVEKISRRQAVAELLVETANKFVIGNMGEKFSYMIPFVAAAFCYQCGIQPDQPCRTAKPYSRSFHRSCMGSCCIYHDHGTEDQDKWFRWIYEGIYNSDPYYDTI